MMNKERGAVLYLVVIIAIICAIAAYGALFAATSHGDRARFYRKRTPALYAAEAAQVWAMQRLWDDPNWSAPSGQVVNINGVNVTVTMHVCSQVPCEQRTIKTTVTN